LPSRVQKIDALHPERISEADQGDDEQKQHQEEHALFHRSPPGLGTSPLATRGSRVGLGVVRSMMRRVSRAASLHSASSGARRANFARSERCRMFRTSISKRKSGARSPSWRRTSRVVDSSPSKPKRPPRYSRSASETRSMYSS